MPDQANKIEKPKREFLGVCKNCKRPFSRPEDKCECRPYLCYHCCECDMDCDLCNCKHKR